MRDENSELAIAPRANFKLAYLPAASYTPPSTASPSLLNSVIETLTSTVVIECKMHQCRLEQNFEDNNAALSRSSAGVSNACENLLFRPEPATNWLVVVPKDVVVKRDIIPMFAQRVNDDYGMLSQYWDIQGNYPLNKIAEAPTLQEVGGGMYMTPSQKTTHQLKDVKEFLPLQTLQVYMGIIAIRESQHIQASHNEFEDIDLRCFLQSIQYLTEEGQLTKRMDSYHVYVRMPSGEDRKITPEVNTRVSLEWIVGVGVQHSPSDRKWQLASGYVVKRLPHELAATGADFCVLVQHEPGQKRPLIHDQFSSHVRDTAFARLKVHFDVKPLEQQLDAVNRFCHSDHAPVERLRHIIQGGVKSKDEHRFDIRKCPKDQTGWKVQIKNRNPNLNDGQVHVVEKLSDIEDGVMVVEGPPGTGKTRTLSAVIWTALEEGHRVAIIGPSNASLDNAARAIHKSRPMQPWAREKKIIRAETAAREKNVLMEEVGRSRSGLDTFDSTRFTDAVEAFIAANLNDQSKLAEVAQILKVQEQDLTQLNTLKQLNERSFHYPDAFRLATHIKKLIARNKQDAERARAERQGADIMETDVPDVTDLDKSSRYRSFHDTYERASGYVGKKGSAITRKSTRNCTSLFCNKERRFLAEADIVNA
ncbi:MAG: hypothetical protein Q9192_005813 [Flavoplaca navasiana]